MSAAISIEGNLNDYELLDILAILSNKRETGVLKVAFKPMQGLFYFVDGELSAAYVGNLSGISAVHLAISMEGTYFRFEPRLRIAATHFSEPNERRLLNKLLELESAVFITDQGTTFESEVAGPISDSAALETPAPIAPGEEKESRQDNSDLASPAATLAIPFSSIAKPPSSPDHLGSTWQSFQYPEPSNALIKRRRIFYSAACILVIGIVAAFGITRFRGKANGPVPISASAVAAQASDQDASRTIATPENTTSADKTIPADIGETSSSAPAGTEGALVETKLTPKNETTNSSHADGSRREKSKATANEGTESVGPADEKPAPPLVKEIPVVVRIENGHVAEAYVRNRQAGSEAFEATALRLARQRRYPKDATGSETVVIRVTTQP